MAETKIERCKLAAECFDGLEKIHRDQAVKDVTPFLERSRDVSLLTFENLKNMLLKTRALHKRGNADAEET